MSVLRNGNGQTLINLCFRERREIENVYNVTKRSDEIVWTRAIKSNNPTTPTPPGLAPGMSRTHIYHISLSLSHTLTHTVSLCLTSVQDSEHFNGVQLRSGLMDYREIK